jgi:hypothetical protein
MGVIVSGFSSGGIHRIGRPTVAGSDQSRYHQNRRQHVVRDNPVRSAICANVARRQGQPGAFGDLRERGTTPAQAVHLGGLIDLYPQVKAQVWDGSAPSAHRTPSVRSVFHFLRGAGTAWGNSSSLPRCTRGTRIFHHQEAVDLRPSAPTTRVLGARCLCFVIVAVFEGPWTALNGGRSRPWGSGSLSLGCPWLCLGW